MKSLHGLKASMIDVECGGEGSSFTKASSGNEYRVGGAGGRTFSSSWSLVHTGTQL